MSHEQATTHSKHTQALRFAERVRDLSGGTIEVKVYPAGQLYSDRDALAAIGSGTVHMIWPSMDYLVGYDRRLGMLSLPFMLSDYYMANPAFREELRNLVSPFLEVRGLRLLDFMRTSDAFFVFRDLDPRSPRDLQGKRIRVPGGGATGRVLQAYGASAIQIPAPEVTTALSQGTIDGLITSGSGWESIVGRLGRHAVRVPGFYYQAYALLVDELWWMSLSDQDRFIIAEALYEQVLEQWADAKAEEEAAIGRMVAAGSTFHEIQGDELAPWVELGEPALQAVIEEHEEMYNALRRLKEAF